MGLDMYLNRHNYIWGKSESKVAEVTAEDWDGNVTTKRYDRVTYIVQEVGYWRKANAIHKWFVDNVQKGVDDCKPYDVEKDDLETLKALCLKALEKKQRYLELVNKCSIHQESFADGGDDDTFYSKETEDDKELEKIEEELDSILPTQSGFFFGSTTYDEWYFNNLENTVKIIDKIFEEDPNCSQDYYYEASW